MWVNSSFFPRKQFFDCEPLKSLMRKCEKAPDWYSLVENLRFFLDKFALPEIVDKKSGQLVAFGYHIFLFLFLTTPLQMCTSFGRLSVTSWSRWTPS